MHCTFADLGSNKVLLLLLLLLVNISEASLQAASAYGRELLVNTWHYLYRVYSLTRCACRVCGTGE